MFSYYTNYLQNYIYYIDTLLVVRLVRKHNSEESRELPSTKRQRISDCMYCMYCYYKKQFFILNFLDDDSDASTMESQDTEVNVLTYINKVEEGINMYKCLIFYILSEKLTR